jgi:hypothetical protein
MAEWFPAGQHFIEADVIRWQERVYQSTRRGKSKAVKIGERRVVAEVLHDVDGWVCLLVRHCELISAETGRLTRTVPLLQPGAEVKRKRQTIIKGKVERMQWSDENVRSVIASKFLGRGPRVNE